MEENKNSATATKGKKDKQLHLRCSTDERQQLEERAKKASKNLSEYMIACSLGAEIKERMPLEVRRYIIGIGTNLNQLTRLANAGKLSVESEDKLKKMVEALSDLLLTS